MVLLRASFVVKRQAEGEQEEGQRDEIKQRAGVEKLAEKPVMPYPVPLEGAIGVRTDRRRSYRELSERIRQYGTQRAELDPFPGIHLALADDARGLV